MPKEFPTVSVIIVNHNSGEFLARTVGSILSNNYPLNKLEIIIVDNASIDKSVENLLKKYKEEFHKLKNFVLIKNVKNEGWCKAINKGLNLAKGDIIIFSNHDVNYSKNSIRKIVNYLLSYNDVGICQFFSLLPSGDPDVAACYLDPLGYAYNFLTSRPCFVSFGEAVAIAIKRDVIKKIGGLDEDYFIEYEDQDFCWRALLAGYKILFVPEATVTHYRGSVEKPIWFLREKRVMLYTKNHISTLIKNLEFRNLLFLLPIVLAIEISKAMYVLLVHKKVKLFFKIIQGIITPFLTLPRLIKKRVEIQKLRVVSDNELFKKYFVPFMPIYQVNYLKYQGKGKRYIIKMGSKPR
ncbi:MAG: glycosyltransferase family 2 protein [Candidatus Baldrarchaeia archaeon]